MRSGNNTTPHPLTFRPTPSRRLFLIHGPQLFPRPRSGDERTGKQARPSSPHIRCPTSRPITHALISSAIASRVRISHLISSSSASSLPTCRSPQLISSAPAHRLIRPTAYRSIQTGKQASWQDGGRSSIPSSYPRPGPSSPRLAPRVGVRGERRLVPIGHSPFHPSRNEASFLFC